MTFGNTITGVGMPPSVVRAAIEHEQTALLLQTYTGERLDWCKRFLSRELATTPSSADFVYQRVLEWGYVGKCDLPGGVAS
jgi:hypothetical protein